MQFSPIRCDESAYADYMRLFSKCFPNSDKYNLCYLDWLYRLNPDGEALGFDAYDGERLAGHYVCIPVRVHVGGEKVRVLLSLNTATHPDYQGQGLFTKLAKLTYTAGAEQGYDCVYGIANANSTPGFVRKLKFDLVSPLQAKVGIGSLGIDMTQVDGAQFRRVWSRQSLAWRCASPENPVISRLGNDRVTFLAPALLGGGCMASAEICVAESDGSVPMTANIGRASALRLFIGLIPPLARRHAFYADIPVKLRPSPLNLIYRSLSGRIPKLDPNSVFLNFLDFDAY